MKPYFSLEKLDLYHGDASVLETFEKGFYDLCVTSPPYNLSIEYQGSDDFRAYDDYLNWCKNWLKNCYFWGKEQARLCLNVPLDTNKHGKQSLGADITIVAKECGWKYQKNTKIRSFGMKAIFQDAPLGGVGCKLAHPMRSLLWS